MNGFFSVFIYLCIFCMYFSWIKKEDFSVLDWFGNRTRYMDTDFLKKSEHRYQNSVAATNIINFVSVKQGFERSEVFLLKVVICCRRIWFDMSISPNLDLLCVQQSDATPLCENYAKLYFDAKLLFGKSCNEAS